MAKQIPEIPEGGGSGGGGGVPNPGKESPRPNKYKRMLIGVAIVLISALIISAI